MSGENFVIPHCDFAPEVEHHYEVRLPACLNLASNKHLPNRCRKCHESRNDAEL
jgi:hypothetical protein